VALVFVFVCSESVIINYMMKPLGQKTRLRTCIKYSFVGFFYSCITPSASGGQPMQLYYMVKDGLSTSVSTIVLMVVTIAYKLVLVLTSLLAFIFSGSYISSCLGDVKFILIYGIIANVLFISAFVILILKPNMAQWLAIKWISFLAFFHIVKDKEARIQRTKDSMENYRESGEYLVRNPLMFVKIYIITFIQRMALFAVTWCVYKSFGLSGTSLYQILILQTIISLSVDMLPLPGGVGASEASFLVMFEHIFGKKLLYPGMLLSRGISYYFLVAVSGAVSVAAHIISQKKEKTG
ncbi:MAG: flippase-like domain-containing protein, partial [Lachnospiraceae bacterium]|nr:flippase-like domain-containing protein [Lachnospiraceae bacterium]